MPSITINLALIKIISKEDLKFDYRQFSAPHKIIDV